jgi:hypothetical protein
MKVGDLIRNIQSRQMFKSLHALSNTGIVVEMPRKDDEHPQVVVAVEGNLELWELRSVELVPCNEKSMQIS